jgi:hypothetical protein
VGLLVAALAMSRLEKLVPPEEEVALSEELALPEQLVLRAAETPCRASDQQVFPPADFGPAVVRADVPGVST